MSRTVVIQLNDAAPVSIVDAEWPEVSGADVGDGLTFIAVRQHQDGRRIVYGRGKFAGDFAGFLIPSKDVHRVYVRLPNGAEVPKTAPDDEATVHAIRRAAGIVKDHALGTAVINGLPPRPL